MSSLAHRLTFSRAATRSLAIAALLGGTFLMSPLTAARADDAAAQSQAATDAKAETVEQRITSLHAALKIVPTEDAKWNDVAQAMRENSAAMQKLVAERTATPPQNRTAIDDLKGYEKFAQAHVDGLKNLTASFETLYLAMPDPQKKLADQVFQSFGHEAASSHS